MVYEEWDTPERPEIEPEKKPEPVKKVEVPKHIEQKVKKVENITKPAVKNATEAKNETKKPTFVANHGNATAALEKL